MMSTGLSYQLKSNAHLDNIKTAISSLYSNQKYSDVLLLVSHPEGGAGINAHKIILGSCSQYFASIFESYPTPPNAILHIVLPPELSRSAVLMLVEFMYNGSIVVANELLSEVLLGADILKISGLGTLNNLITAPGGGNIISTAPSSDVLQPPKLTAQSQLTKPQQQVLMMPKQQQQQFQHQIKHVAQQQVIKSTGSTLHLAAQPSVSQKSIQQPPAKLKKTLTKQPTPTQLIVQSNPSSIWMPGMVIGDLSTNNEQIDTTQKRQVSTAILPDQSITTNLGQNSTNVTNQNSPYYIVSLPQQMSSGGQQSYVLSKKLITTNPPGATVQAKKPSVVIQSVSKTYETIDITSPIKFGGKQATSKNIITTSQLNPVKRSTTDSAIPTLSNLPIYAVSKTQTTAATTTRVQSTAAATKKKRAPPKSKNPSIATALSQSIVSPITSTATIAQSPVLVAADTKLIDDTTQIKEIKIGDTISMEGTQMSNFQLIDFDSTAIKEEILTTTTSTTATEWTVADIDDKTTKMDIGISGSGGTTSNLDRSYKKEEDRDFKCGICSKTFAISTEWYDHISTHCGQLQNTGGAVKRKTETESSSEDAHKVVVLSDDSCVNLELLLEKSSYLVSKVGQENKK